MKKIFTLLFLSLLCVFCAIGFAACENTKTTTNNTANTNSTSENDIPAKTYYTVTFNSNGGTEINPIQVENGKKCVAPLDPVKQYYIFDGWYVGSEKWSFIGYTITDDITLTAKWSADENYLDIFDWEKTNNKYIIKDIKDNSIKNIVIPDYVTEIGNGAFQNCTELENIIIPDNIKRIGYYALQYCYKLKYTEYENGYYIGNSNNPYLVLLGTKSTITSFSILNTTKIILDTAFALCDQLSQITIPDNIISIGMNLFEGCESLTSVVFTKNITSIPAWTFSGCSSLANITLHESVTAIEDFAFFDCGGLTNITLPDGITSIGDNSFWGCSSLTSITIPDSITNIGEGAFQHCSSLTSITIPNKVTSIGEQTFYDCSSLTSINVDVNNFSYKSIDGNLYSKDGTILIQYAIGKTSTAFTIPNNVTSIGISAFRDCSSLINITIPNSVTSIGISAFYNCRGLTSITIPDSVTSIGVSAFGYCSSLADINVSENNQNYKSIDGNLYSKDGTILIQYAIGKVSTSFTIPNNVTSIGIGAFRGCSSLANIAIPDSVAKIGEWIFGDCKSLENINYNGTKLQWNSIVKDASWKTFSAINSIVCTDGTIDL